MTVRYLKFIEEENGFSPNKSKHTLALNLYKVTSSKPGGYAAWSGKAWTRLALV